MTLSLALAKATGEPETFDMRVMHIITTLGTGGAEIMLLKLLSVPKKDWDPIVVCLTDEGSIGPRISALDVPLYTLGMWRSVPSPVRVLSIMRFVRKCRPQLIQGWMPHGNFMASLARISRQGQVPVVWNIRQCLYDLSVESRTTQALIRLGAWVSEFAAAIVYNTETGAKQHEALGYDVSKRIVIPNGFDCSIYRPDDGARRRFRAELGIGNEAILVGLVARHHPMKDHASFFRAAGMVKQKHPNTYFLGVGKSVSQDQPELVRLIAESKLQNRTFLLGERSDIPAITAALDIACSTSWTEGFSNTVGEAMACGVPCVVTDVGDSSQLVADTGSVVPPRDPQSLARAIGKLIEAGTAHRQRLGAAARRRIESDFSLSAVADRYEDLYRKHLRSSN